MSFRGLAKDGEQLARMLRDHDDRLRRIESGGLLTGRISVGSPFQIGDVQLTVRNGPGTQRFLDVVNTLSGATYTITL